MFPYRVESLYQVTPWSNLFFLAFCLGVPFLISVGLFTPQVFSAEYLPTWSFAGALGNIFYHADLWSLILNLYFLWVFGNAICMNTDNFLYPVLFLTSGVTGSALQWAVDGSMVFGAGAAICGTIGLVFALYPVNKIDVVLITLKRSIFSFPTWGVVSCLAGAPIVMALLGIGGFAYWADLGGFVTGLLTGLFCLKTGLIKTTVYDNRTLLDILSGKKHRIEVKDLTEGWQQYYRHMTLWR